MAHSAETLLILLLCFVDQVVTCIITVVHCKMKINIHVLTIEVRILSRKVCKYI